jgi:membrane fusion protein (multidrug efflux system)
VFKKKRGWKVYIPLVLVIIIVLGGAYFWYREYTKYISSDDARLDTDLVSVSPKILGRIIKLYVDEGDSVKQGTLLVELDSTDLVAQRNQALAMKKQALATVTQSETKLKYDQESIKVLQVNLDKTNDDYTRAKSQYDGNVITKEQYDHITKAMEAAKAQLEAAKSQLDVSKAQIQNSIAAVGTADAQINVIQTQLGNTKIYSPVDGIVAKRWLLPGDISQPGQSVFTLNNSNKLWATVFLEETKLSGVHLFQKCYFTVDAIPDVTFEGRIFEIMPNTASQFSLIPPNNASGNFTKITQRVPIKISIEGTDKKVSPSAYKLLSGMSIIVKIVRD